MVGRLVPDFIRFHARARGGHVAMIEAASGRRLSYAELDRTVDAAVTVLEADFSIGQGDRIAALARNSLELVILHLACARLGAIFVPLNWRLSPVELAAVLEDCAPRLLVGDAMLSEVAPPAGAEAVSLDEVARRIAAADPAPARPTDADLPSLMLYTSGTSGRPKGVLLSERNLFATALNFGVIGQVTPASVFLADSPMFHIIGMVTNLRPPFMVGATTIVSGAFDPAVTLDRMGDPALGVTHYFCVPQMAEMLRAAPNFDPGRLGGMTAIFTGGAPHPEARIREWLRDGIPIVDGYGMTEAGTVLGMPLSCAAIDPKAGSAGLMPPTMESRIVDAGDRDCGPDEVGELLLRGPNIFAGYWRRPEETEAALGGGWFRTGDLVRRDADGFHYVVDRRKDMFISGGENIYPAEVEAALAAHPDVGEAAVVGMPDPRWGEVGHAAIVARPGAAADADALIAHCAGRLARYKLPKRIHFVTALPRTGSGKVVKAELKRVLAERAG